MTLGPERFSNTVPNACVARIGLIPCLHHIDGIGDEPGEAAGEASGHEQVDHGQVVAASRERVADELEADEVGADGGHIAHDGETRSPRQVLVAVA